MMPIRMRILALLFLAGLCANEVVAEDEIEFLSGAKIKGLVTSIDKENKAVDFDAKVAGRTLSRSYPYSKIHAITFKGKRYVLNEMSDPAPRPGNSDDGNSADAGSGSSPKRSPTSVKALIEQAGKTPPDWYGETPLDYPQSLDLSWPQKPPGGWNNQKNVGQYLWDVIHPNPDRWRSGVKLIHHLLALHQKDPEIRQRAMRTLGGMYFNLFQDYARAAFWWQQGGVNPADNGGVALGECYWRLGDRKTAETFLVDPNRPRPNNMLRIGMIKLWGDMGETDKAVKVAEWYVRAGGEQDMAYLFAGDALRLAGRYQEALRMYQKAIDSPDAQNKKHSDVIKKRARASLEAIKLFELADVSRVADGTYRADSIGYSGPVEVEVNVQSGRIAAVRVTKHTEKQFYAALTDVPNQIIQKQGVKGVDATSRATMTGEAIINATAKALAKGAK